MKKSSSFANFAKLDFGDVEDVEFVKGMVEEQESAEDDLPDEDEVQQRKRKPKLGKDTLLKHQKKMWTPEEMQEKELYFGPFLDKVRMARKVRDQGEENRKEKVVVVLGDLDEKKYRKEALSTVFSVALYSTENWEATERLFSTAADTSTSFPQNIFRQLQGVPNDMRTLYLTRAIGTNGVKIVRHIETDKRRDQLKKLPVAILKEDSWEDVCLLYISAEKILDYTGEVSTAEGRECSESFVHGCEKNDKRAMTVSISNFALSMSCESCIGWHNKLNRKAGGLCLSFYRLVPILQSEAEEVSYELHPLRDGISTRHVHPAARKIEEKIRELWKNKFAGNIEISELLEGCDAAYGPQCEE